MKKRMIALFMTVVMLCTLLPTAAFADKATASGMCGSALVWTLASDGTLTVSGVGKMNNYTQASDVPWHEYTDSITAVVIKKNVTSIGDYCFYGCEKLKAVAIPGKITSVGSYAFMNCKGLEMASVPENVQTIGIDAFYATPWLKSLGEFATVNGILLAYQGSATAVTVPEGVSCINAYAFRGCTKLKSISIPLSVTSVGKSAFFDCTKLKNVYYAGSSDDWSKIKFADGNKCLTDAKLHYGVSGIAPDAPVVSVSVAKATGVPKLTWKAVSGAEKYEVYRATNKTGTYTKLGTTTGTSFSNTSATAGKTYYYKVKAVSADGTKSDYSTAVSAAAFCAQPEVKLTNVASSGKIKISWESVKGASKYEVYRATSKSGTYSKLASTINLSYTDTSAVAGKTYYYKVKAICTLNANGNSDFSSVHYLTCDLAKPTARIALSKGDPKVSWSKVDGATKYDVYRAVSKSGTYVKIASTKNTSYTDTLALSKKTYYYKVKAVCDTSAATSAYSGIVSIKAK